MSTRRWIAVAACGLAATTALQAQEGLPKRKAGLWEVSMQMPGTGAPAMSSKQCVDEKSDEAMQKKAMAGNDQKAQCKQTSLKRISGGVEIEAECKSDEGVTKVHSRMTGDMQSTYTVDNTMTFTPPRHGMSTAKMTMQARHGGACPADMKPGDIRMGGMNFNPGAAGGMPAGIDIEKLKNMTPEERAKFMEQMKKSMGQ
ncbi:DUF3617 family protein [Aquincola sp. S2]|uniref:DUF3617 family protein n=1 Tax=Pseudaquabacterium terrae TaxID=2732868 RepID=A0ABX2EG33_9BURK|nr:DUF3617 family protein [Aquabacterium terrae]NRF67605.1 DUF3617 family protein [Aquabacterium terrae]